MPEILKKYLGSIIRTLLTSALAFLVQKGYVSESDTTEMVMWLTGVILVLLWSLYEKYSSQLQTLTALTMPQGATLEHVKEKIASPATVNPSVMTPVDEVPVAPPAPPSQ